MSFFDYFARSVVEETGVTETIAGASGDYSRIEDVYDALKWRLARNPESGVVLDTPQGVYYLIKTPIWKISGVPVLTALYRFDGNEVVIISIKVDES